MDVKEVKAFQGNLNIEGGRFRGLKGKMSRDL